MNFLDRVEMCFVLYVCTFLLFAYISMFEPLYQLKNKNEEVILFGISSNNEEELQNLAEIYK